MRNFWGAVHQLGEYPGEYAGEYLIFQIPLNIGISALLGEYGEGVFKFIIMGGGFSRLQPGNEKKNRFSFGISLVLCYLCR